MQLTAFTANLIICPPTMPFDVIILQTIQALDRMGRVDEVVNDPEYPIILLYNLILFWGNLIWFL